MTVGKLRRIAGIVVLGVSCGISSGFAGEYTITDHLARETVSISAARHEPQIAEIHYAVDMGTNVTLEDDRGPRINNLGEVALGSEHISRLGLGVRRGTAGEAVAWTGWQ